MCVREIHATSTPRQISASPKTMSQSARAPAAPDAGAALADAPSSDFVNASSDAATRVCATNDAAKAIKISIPRPYPQGAREDGDAYGGQQHAPLVELEMPD